MGGTRMYYPEWGNPLTKEHTWYAFTDKWILAQKLQIPKIQFNDHMKLKKEEQSVGVSVLLRLGNKILMEANIEKKCGEETAGKASKNCPTWWSILYTVTKPRYYCGCQKVHSDRSLTHLSPHRLCQSLTNTEADAHSQSLNWARSPQCGPQWRS